MSEDFYAAEAARLGAERDEAVKRRNEIQDEWARRMALLVALCSGREGALDDATLIPVGEVKRAILDAFGAEGEKALGARPEPTLTVHVSRSWQPISWEHWEDMNPGYLGAIPAEHRQHRLALRMPGPDRWNCTTCNVEGDLAR